MPNDCQVGLKGTKHAMTCAPSETLPSLARPGLFGD
jgi:hypothetical protein